MVELYRRLGLSEASREVGIPKSTILRWVDEYGVDRAGVSRELADRQVRAARASVAKRVRETEEARERMVARLAKISEAAAIRELELLAAGGFAQTDLRQITDARVKAVRDLELLEGRATSRVGLEGEAEMLSTGMLHAFRAIYERLVELVGRQVADELRLQFAHGLREAHDEWDAGRLNAETLELPAGDVVDEDGDA